MKVLKFSNCFANTSSTYWNLRYSSLIPSTPSQTEFISPCIDSASADIVNLELGTLNILRSTPENKNLKTPTKRRQFTTSTHVDKPWNNYAWSCSYSSTVSVCSCVCVCVHISVDNKNSKTFFNRPDEAVPRSDLPNAQYHSRLCD